MRDALDSPEIEPDTYPESHKGWERWMCHKEGSKTPYAPWTPADSPAPCNHEDHPEPVTCDECDHSAKWKWSWEENYRTLEKAQMAVDAMPHVAGMLYIQKDDDPFLFVDGDDVRDPATGEIHPAFIALLEQFGDTFADVSTSGTGVHALYKGTLPGDMAQHTPQIDTEPWGENDDPPVIEIYATTKVCVTTGKHIIGTPDTARQVNQEVLNAFVEATTETPTQSTQDRLEDLRKGTPDGAAPGGGPDTDGQQTPLDAVQRLNAFEVAEKTIVDRWLPGTTGKTTQYKAFDPSYAPGSPDNRPAYVWDSSSGGGFKDEGEYGAGGIIEMACIDAGILNARSCAFGSADGDTWRRGYEHLRRELEFDLPPLGDSDDDNDGTSPYYEVDLDEHGPTGVDVWSDDQAFVLACLRARRDEPEIASDTRPPTRAAKAVYEELLAPPDTWTDDRLSTGRDLFAEIDADRWLHKAMMG